MKKFCAEIAPVSSIQQQWLPQPINISHERYLAKAYFNFLQARPQPWRQAWSLRLLRPSLRRIQRAIRRLLVVNSTHRSSRHLRFIEPEASTRKVSRLKSRNKTFERLNWLLTSGVVENILFRLHFVICLRFYAAWFWKEYCSIIKLILIYLLSFIARVKLRPYARISPRIYTELIRCQFVDF